MTVPRSRLACAAWRRLAAWLWVVRYGLWCSTARHYISARPTHLSASPWQRLCSCSLQAAAQQVQLPPCACCSRHWLWRQPWRLGICQALRLLARCGQQTLRLFEPSALHWGLSLGPEDLFFALLAACVLSIPVPVLQALPEAALEAGSSALLTVEHPSQQQLSRHLSTVARGIHEAPANPRLWQFAALAAKQIAARSTDGTSDLRAQRWCRAAEVVTGRAAAVAAY
jgi:hypothetical protein